MNSAERSTSFRGTQILSFTILVFLFVGTAGLPLSSTATAQTFKGQAYTGRLLGNELWLNASYPFESQASNSRILHLPAVQSWLDQNNYSISDTKPYISLYPSEGNPNDFSDMTITKSGVTYYDYLYLLPHSLVVGVWVSEGSTPSVARIYDYNLTMVVHASFNSGSGVGMEAEDTSATGTSGMDGAVYSTDVFSDLSSPSPCTSSYCWAWLDWLGTSNYDWTSTTLPSNPFFFQGEVAYWGGNLGKPSTCGSSSFTSNCIMFQYALDSTSLQTDNTGDGDWGSGDGVSIEWYYSSTSNCTPAGGGAGNTVDEQVEDTTSSTTATDSKCMVANNTYSQFLSEQPGNVFGNPDENPEFSTHYLSGNLINPNNNYIPLNSGQSEITILGYNTNLTTELVSVTSVSNGSTQTTWDQNWIASQYN